MDNVALMGSEYEKVIDSLEQMQEELMSKHIYIFSPFLFNKLSIDI